MISAIDEEVDTIIFLSLLFRCRVFWFLLVEVSRSRNVYVRAKTMSVGQFGTIEKI